MLHDRARRQDRVSRPEDAGDGAGPAVAPIHHRGVHLLRAGGGEDGAAPGIEQRVVLERDDRRGHRIERGAAAGEHIAAGLQCAAQPGMVWPRRSAFIAPRRERAGAAMHGERKGFSIAFDHARHMAPTNRRGRQSAPMKRAWQANGRSPDDPGAIVIPRPLGAPSPLRLVLLGLGISVVPLDTAVNIAFPDITGSFGLPIPMIQWVVICYVLTHAGLMLAFGRVGDIWGHARVFRAGLAVEHRPRFCCAPRRRVLAALLFFRFLQGIGAGLIISCAPALVTSLYPEARRSHALGMFTLMFAIGSASGPLIGGALVAHWGWPAVFWFRAPIALTGLLLLRGLPAATPGARRAALRHRRGAAAGFGLARCCSGSTGCRGCARAICSALSCSGRRRQPGRVRLVGGAARRSRSCRSRCSEQLGFAAINAGERVMYLITFSVMLIAPYFLVDPYRAGPAAGRLVLASGFIAMAAASPLAGGLVARSGPGGSRRSERWRSGSGCFRSAIGARDAAPADGAVLAVQGSGRAVFRSPIWRWSWRPRPWRIAASPAACRC